MSRAPIEDALERHRERWMSIEGVTGVGIGRCDDRPCLKVFVDSVTPRLEHEIPDEVEGHPVRLEPTGRFRARPPSS